MENEFKCGIYSVFSPGNGMKWSLKVNQYTIGLIEADGTLIRFTANCPLLSMGDLMEISVLMIHIKKQYANTI